ncbi:MAG: peroxidase [Saprospiraceae bacterium]|jgi:peroxidase
MKKLTFVIPNSKIGQERKTLILLLFSFFLLTNLTAQHQTEPYRNLSVNGQTFKHKVRVASVSRDVCDREPNRTADGTCNNIVSEETTEWGATDIAFAREMYPAYGAPDFLNDMAGNCRLTPRAISNIVCAQEEEDVPSPRGLSSMVFTWAQFIDHDITLTPEGEMEYVPVLLPSNEPLFVLPIPFLRSEVFEETGETTPRQQENLITSWLDGSQVYGSDEERAAWLRTFSQGKLKTSAGNLLPYNTLDTSAEGEIDPDAPSMAGDGGGTSIVFVAGDVRANEQPGLTSLHTIFVREHNRICDQLIANGMNNEEQIYQTARKRVGAYIQSITYNFFLPAMGVDVAPYMGYNSELQPDMSNMFATAAYRLGHTMVTTEILLIGIDCVELEDGSLPLLAGFFNPAVIVEYGVEPFLQGLAAQTQQKVDTKIVDDLRNFLFPSQGGDPFGLDLASLNIQRGRDHGLPDYNSVRAYFTGFGAEEFSDITGDSATQVALADAYGSVYDMDLWVGLLAEDPIAGSSVGLTLNAILGSQFQKIRDGDYYYYLNDPAFDANQRNQISNTFLSEIIERNTPIESLQANIFFAVECNGTPPGGGGGNGGGPGGGGPGGGGGNGGGGGGNPPGGGNGGGNFINPGLTIFPNPARGQSMITANFQDEAVSVIIKVKSLTGQEVYQTVTTAYDGIMNYNLNLENLVPGLYMITTQAGDELFSKKIVVE